MVAAQSGRADAIRFLLKNGAKSSLTNSRSETAVHYAASSSSYPEACITALLGQHSGQPGGGSLIDHQDCDGSTALMVAARNQSSSKSAAAAAVSILLKLGADVSLVDNQQRTALHWAAQSNLPDVVTVLHAANIEVDAIDNFGDTAYVTAIKSNSPDALESLIRVGCDRSMIDGLMGTAVALAAVKGHAQVIETLVKNGEDPDDFGYFGKTPLMLAGFESHAEAVDMLLSLGADPDITSHTGGTALVSALLRTSSSNEVNRHRIVLSLIRAGVDVNQRPMLPDQKTATATNQFKAVCSSQHGRNWPLSYAIDTGYVSLIRILLIAGSRVPADEIRQRQLINTRFFDLDELLGPVLEWTSQPVSLQHASRADIRQSILSGHYHCSSLPSEFSLEQAIRSLPIADRLMGYLNFAELDSIKIHRARVLDGAKPGMMQLGESTPCGMRAIEGTIRPTGPPAIAGHN
jgi:ankyrin repeat protein